MSDNYEYEERAAILEYEEGLPREEAEKQAKQMMEEQDELRERTGES